MSTIIDRVAKIADRFDELTELMADPAVAADFSRLSEIDRERQEIEELAATYRRYAGVESQLAENQLLLDDADADMRELAEAEIESLKAEREELDQQMKALLLSLIHTSEPTRPY